MLEYELICNVVIVAITPVTETPSNPTFSPLSAFIIACQDDDAGGVADRPGNMSDPFHTLFGLAGLAMLRAREDCAGLRDINPVYCMPQSVIDRMGLKPQMLDKAVGSGRKEES